MSPLPQKCQPNLQTIRGLACLFGETLTWSGTVATVGSWRTDTTDGISIPASDQDSARRDAATQKAFRDIRTVGLSIVKTLNRHTRILERVDRKLGVRGNGPGPTSGRTP